MEALDLAVGLGVVGPCAATAHAGGEARARERGAAISGAVVGEHGAHGDAALGEPGASPLPKGDRGDRALVGEDLAVGEAGVVVDHGVDVSVANAAVAVMAVATAAVDAPAAAWGDAAQLLDVHVEQVSGPGVLVAAADHPPGRPVQPAEAVEAEPAEHAVYGRRGHAQPPGDAGGAELAAAAEPLDAALEASRDAGRGALRPARSVLQAGLALGQPALPPLVGGLAGDTHLGGDVRRRTATLNTLDEDAASCGGELGVTVHMSLLGIGATGCVATPSLGGSLHSTHRECYQRSWRSQLARALRSVREQSGHSCCGVRGFLPTFSGAGSGP